MRNVRSPRARGASSLRSAVDEMEAHTDLVLQQHLREQEALLRVRTRRNDVRPVNTKKQYAPRQKEYIEWCFAKNYQNDTVTPGRMVLFLTEMQERPIRPTGRKRKVDETHEMENATGETIYCQTNTPDAHTIGYPALAAYVNTLMDLLKVQYELDQTDRVPIRPAAVKELLKLKQMAMVDEENSTFKDRGIGTMVDSVDQTSLREVADKLFSEMTEVGLKHRADNLVTYALATRGDNIRRVKLSNIGLIVFENEGFGNVEESTFMRHKDVTRCPFGALGLYFLCRWCIGGEPCPDLSDPELWYDIYALKGSNPKTPMKYSHQYQAIKKQHESLGLRSTSKTKAGRKSAAVTAEHEGASGHSVDKHGHWATRTRDGSYANHVVPWETVRTLAGFGPEKGRYYVERAMVAVPKDLQCMVFPWIESARVAMNLKRRDIAGESFCA
ncbi:hypothetical protein LEN26_019248 [Aphanomyces euteiches]|nr:hypothetical protein LEN26_019248 [Aphanomyces euteiches]